jgi:hypothetical protein
MAVGRWELLESSRKMAKVEKFSYIGLLREEKKSLLSDGRGVYVSKNDEIHGSSEKE